MKGKQLQTSGDRPRAQGAPLAPPRLKPILDLVAVRLKSAILALAAVAAFAAACLVSRPGSAEELRPPTLSSIMAAFAAMPGLEARFREEKRIALLAEPLVSEGTLLYARPGKLARHTRSPVAFTLLVERDQVRFGDGHETQRLDLQANPLARQLVESYLHLLAGDESSLEGLYRLEFQPLPDVSGEAWQLVLTPRAAAMARVITRVEVRGRGLSLERIRVVEATGDETVTSFSHVDPARQFSHTELTDLFALPQQTAR